MYVRKLLYLAFLYICSQQTHATDVWTAGISNGRLTGANNFMTFDTARMTTEAGMVWINRCLSIDGSNCPNRNVLKGNYYHIIEKFSGNQVRPMFTTVEKADFCTRMNAARMYRYPDSFLDNLGNRAGISWLNRDALTVSYMAANVRTINSRSYLVDQCIVPAKPRQAVTTIVFDHEPHDRRSGADVKRLYRLLRSDARQWRSIFVFTNSLSNDSTRHRNGWVDGALSAIDIDGVMPVVWSGASVNRNPTHTFLSDYQGTLLHVPDDVDLIPFISGWDATPTDVADVQALNHDAIGIWKHYRTWEYLNSVVDAIQ